MSHLARLARLRAVHERASAACPHLPHRQRLASSLLRWREFVQHRQDRPPIDHSDVPRNLLRFVAPRRRLGRCGEERRGAPRSTPQGHHHRELRNF